MRRVILCAVVVLAGAISRAGEPPTPAQRVAAYVERHRATGALAKMEGKQPAVGLVGRLPLSRVHIEQVIGPEDMLIQVTWSHSAPVNMPLSPSGRGGYKRLPGHTKRVDFWVHGMPTRNLADNTHQTWEQAFSITGTKTYETVDGGPQTIFVIEPVDLQAAASRTWTSVDGKYTTRARFVSATAAAVTLKKDTDSTIKVPLNKLSAADRQYIAEQR